jgi:hypothetical protein
VVRGQTRCGWEPSLDPKELIETGLVARGSPRRAGDGEGVSDNVDDGDSSVKMLLAMKVWTQMGYEVVLFSSK